MKRLTLDFSVGLFLLFGIMCIVILAINVAAHDGHFFKKQPTYILHASFSNIGSLNTGAPVKVSGFVVGRVVNIYLDPNTYHAVVTMAINNKYKFSLDTSAQILTTGLLGEQYVALQSGADPILLQNNNNVTITSSALVLENLIGKFMTNTTAK